MSQGPIAVRTEPTVFILRTACLLSTKYLSVVLLFLGLRKCVVEVSAQIFTHQGKAGDEEAKQRVKEVLKSKLKEQEKKIVSLESAPLRIASEYYTPEEMVSFKKVKKRVKKVRTKTEQVLKADDLLENATSDLGSRTRKPKTEPDLDGKVILLSF